MSLVATFHQREILLDVWREACQHIEIQSSVAGISRILSELLPIKQLEVLRLDAHARHLEVAACGYPHHETSRTSPSLSGRITRLVEEWILSSQLSPLDRRSELPLDDLPGLSSLPSATRIGGLVHGDDLGMLVVVPEDNVSFNLQDEGILRLVLEPLAVALGNDRRLRELTELREAAEADRLSLLARLGRTDINDRVVGEGTGLAPVMHRVNLVSASDAPVLLLGETGTGKEVIARNIHTRSPRHNGPFIRVNCGAIPPELVDSQLFGHEKGSFTGATETRAGWFERADGGTLFLDEIGELPPDAQVRLLRVLQDSYIERVGGREPIRVDVRVVAATHRDLPGMVQTGEFRMDLWYRIAVFPIALPPLRDRVEDIAELADHFVHRAAVRFGLPVVHPTQEHMELLRGYNWPGNIRELGAVIDRAAILGEGRTLEISAALGFSHSPASPPLGISSLLPSDPTPAKVETLDNAMRAHIVRALQHTRGRIEGPRGTASLLGINPHTLRARMRKLGIDWNRYRSDAERV